MPSQQSIKAGDRTIKLNTWQFIGNEWKEAVGKSTFGIENPSTGEEVIQVSEGKAEDVDIAVKTARKTFKDPAYKEMNPTDRSAILQKLADLMQENFDDLVALEMLDTGKTHKQCSNLDVPASIGTLRYYAGWADKVLGLSSFNIPKTFAYTKREPVGVCGQIIPWNFPLLMFTWKIAPAFACGNTVVIKSAEATPLSALYMCDLIVKAGFPAGSINLITGYGKNAGAAIASHMDVNKVAFTGSTVTGRSILKAAASSNLKKVTLELGGKRNIIFPDADLKKAIEWSIWGINMNFGQTCHAGTRIYVHEDVYDEFLELYTARMKKMVVGDNFDKNNTQGPQNSKMQYEKILGYIDSGKSDGATVHLGGNAIKGKDGSKGYFIEPTIFTNVTANMKIMREEIFGPVVAIAKFKTEEEVIEMANDTTYGLAAGVHTKDYERAIRVTSALEAGTTWVNMYNFVHWSIPFGGYKESGIGRECGEAALENYTEVKAVYFNMGMRAPDALDD
ncbi:Aldehyde dehydrogenase [Cyphellophora attinorum]|uniref:Aldehyde dehydrogenase n=1 Tax=Cyphellophora attinorum TaxID=1664694 RepID=A0A0N1P0A3_9EURO|nr:Aldehyde dehydrogenase [Phialophora attinorum]KPI41925.1 Aldehyde dehydrogenase [Phialophora attinorum]